VKDHRARRARIAWIDLERSILVVRRDHLVPLRANISEGSAMIAHIDLRAVKRRSCSAVLLVSRVKIPPAFSTLRHSRLNAPRSRIH
jgi:hypothetical protein